MTFRLKSKTFKPIHGKFSLRKLFQDENSEKNAVSFNQRKGDYSYLGKVSK